MLQEHGIDGLDASGGFNSSARLKNRPVARPPLEKNCRFELCNQIVSRPTYARGDGKDLAKSVVAVSARRHAPRVHLLHRIPCDVQFSRIVSDCKVLSWKHQPFGIDRLVARREQARVPSSWLELLGHVVDGLSVVIALRVRAQLIGEFLPHRPHGCIDVQRFTVCNQLALHTMREAEIEIGIYVVAALVCRGVLETPVSLVVACGKVAPERIELSHRRIKLIPQNALSCV